MSPSPPTNPSEQLNEGQRHLQAGLEILKTGATLVLTAALTQVVEQGFSWSAQQALALARRLIKR